MKKRKAEFNIYCDICDEPIPKGTEYYEDEEGLRWCSVCEEV